MPTKIPEKVLLMLSALDHNATHQTFGALFDGDLSCALGVGLRANGINSQREFTRWQRSHDGPPNLLMSMLSSGDFLGIPRELEDAIISWNDAGRMTFPEIATRIRAFYDTGELELSILIGEETL